MLYAEALENGLLKAGAPPTSEELEEIRQNLIPKPVNFFGLRFPERDAKTDADYLRVSFQEEDEAWREEMRRNTLTEKE